MATTTISTDVTSFVYEDLFSHIQTIQYQMTKCIKYLHDQTTTVKSTRDQLKSRSLTILDPYGNPFTQQYMDHQRINGIIKQFKKNYVPKSFHQWIRFGQIIGGDIVPLNEAKLNSTLAQHDDKYPMITYGEITVWTGDWVNVSPQKFNLRVRLTDNIENIERQLKERTNSTNVVLKTCIVAQNTTPNRQNWNEGKTLQSTDTIISTSLYQDDWIILSNITTPDVNDYLRVFISIRFLFFYRLVQRISVLAIR